MNTIRLGALGGTIALILASAGGTLAKPPTFTVAPGTPVCTVGAPDNTSVCGWTTAGLSPSPAKFAVEVLASYDPDCDDDFDLSKTFRFDTPDADPSFDVPAGALDTTVCTSGDTPCTVPATYHAKSVQVRVKAVNPPSRQGSQNNPFSGLSTALAIPGVCGVVCPQACVTGITEFLVPSFGRPELVCGASILLFGDAFVGGHFERALAQIGGQGTCSAVIGATTLVNIALTPAEQAACIAHFRPVFQSKFNQQCVFP